MKKNNSGFTLIELLAVVLIMIFILLVALPSVSRLIKSNNDKKYEIYHDLVEEAALAYSSSRTDELGGTEGNGCFEISLTDLIDSGYIKTFEDDAISCKTPTESSKDKIKIMNNKGVKSVNVSLICEKNGKVVYSKVIDKQGACNVYVAPAKDILVTSLATSLSGNLTAADSNNNRYVTGNPVNNYVYYSGKLWRVVSINSVSKTVRLITDEAVSITTYGGTAYPGSKIYTWLNNDFLESLKDKETYLESADWDYTSVASITTTLPVNPTVQKSQVGLLSAYEYAKVMNGSSTSFLNKNQHWWLLSSKDASNAWYVNNSNTTASASKNMFYGVRPTITIKANMAFIGSLNVNSGKIDTPFKLMGENPVSSGTLLNTRYSGEYAQFDNGKLYRIVEVNKDYIKIVSDTIVNNWQFDSANCQLTPNQLIGQYLNDPNSNASGAVYKNLHSASKPLIMNGDWCVESVTATVGIQGKRCASNSDLTRANDFKVGLLKVGEMYAASMGSEYWTISSIDKNNCAPYQNTNMNYITATDGRILQKSYEEVSGVRPVFYLSNKVKINGGTGMKGSPFVLYID